MHLDGSPGLRSAKVGKPGRPAPSVRMLGTPQAARSRSLLVQGSTKVPCLGFHSKWRKP